MKVLEIQPLKKKKLNVFILEKEYNEPFWITEPPSSNSHIIESLFQPSIGFHKFVENLIKKAKPAFATEELGMRTEREFNEDNIIAEVFQKNNVPFHSVDIDENAKSYLTTSLEKKKEARDNLLRTLNNLSKQKEKDSTEKEYLIAYGQCLQLELEEQEREVNFSIRESWIIMGIMDHAREFNGEEEITCLHISSPEHVEGIKKLLESLNAKVQVVKLSKKIVSINAEPPSPNELENLLNSMQIQVKPIVGKPSNEAPHLLFYLDTDQKASPFDICMAYDAGYDAVIPYENVTPEDAKRIVQDAVFSRGPKAVKHTCFFIGGKNVQKAEEVFRVVHDTMFPPFKTSTIVDPGGAYTTASAMIAKVEDALSSHKLGELKSKTCAVLGTGAVGQIAAILLAKLGCKVLIASLNPERTDGREHAERTAKHLTTTYGAKVQGIYAPSSTEKIEILKKADVVLCAGGRGIRVIEKEYLRELKLLKVLIDVNTIPPFGVEGIELKDDMREMMPGIFVVGGLTIGELKHKLEKETLRESRSNGAETYDYNSGLQLARKLLRKELQPAKLKLTLNYPPKK